MASIDGADRPRRQDVATQRYARETFRPSTAYLNMLFADHGIFRLVYLNLHRLSDTAWRSSQPAPHHIRALARRGIRTIVNLRGERLCGSYWLEQEACERYGVALVNFHIRSRRAPTREELAAALALFDEVEYPILMHCKSGADRTGLMSALYLLKQGAPLAEARRQLSVRYGYFRHSNAGILDMFFDHYLEDTRHAEGASSTDRPGGVSSTRRQPMPFAQWATTVYDPDRLARSFRPKAWVRRLADYVLRRE
jgi:protein tyrosine phosphatase (PTP) superfamily phosphohydrolase (DUF442 family)